MAIASYTSIADIKDYWVQNIAPKYFNLEDINNYQVGMFGYINEVMANTTEDTFNAINIARREFYPNTAMYKESLNDMAVMQKIGTPVSTPATAKAILVIPEDEVVKRGTTSNGINTCIIDNTMILMADDVPFMLDFPIVILSKRSGKKWIHTSHYDLSVNNSLVTISNKYIMNKSVIENGVRYLFLSVTLRQLKLETFSEIIIKDSVVDTSTVEFSFEGALANFEVFYKEGQTTKQLKKVLNGGAIPQTPFCFYESTNDGIRIIFPKNPYFTPAYNSEVSMSVYTSLGNDGNFEVFKGSLTALINSEKYSYNNTMTITGLINGSSIGGKDIPSDEDYRAHVISAYSTNNTITTSNDLQIYFDSVSLNNNQRHKVLFRKKRDDPAYRIFGAYSLLKDTANNVVPTNTLNVKVLRSQIASESDPSANRLIIKPGTIFEYDDNGTITSYDAKISDTKLMDDLSKVETTKFLFTNPFLINISLNPNIIGYYLNSVNLIRAVEYLYVNDSILTQFIASNFKVDRNALIGENFYKLSITLAPASETDFSDIVEINDPNDEANLIRAKNSGKIVDIKYTVGDLVATVRYTDGTTDTIILNNNTKIQEPVDKNNPIFTPTTGYTLQFKVGDSFVYNDILAIKNVTDKGRIRIAVDVADMLINNQMYIPMFIEGYDETLKSLNIVGYISTDDTLSSDGRILLESGVRNSDSTINDNVAVPMNQVNMSIHAFFKNEDVNYSHKMSEFLYFKNLTLVNTYSQNSNDPSEKIAFIQQIDFIRSTIEFTPAEVNPSSITVEDFYINISEVPISRASWTRDVDNFKYLTSNIYSNYLLLYETYFLLENNFGISLAFYNTYGRARFYRVGIKDDLKILNNVNCSFKFGVFLTSLNSPDLFLTKFRTYVKDYVESVNYVSNNQQSIYIMNMIASIKKDFPEVGYIEYYGFNIYDYSAQKIEGLSAVEIENRGIINYIPEFINIMAIMDGEVLRPNVEVLLLDE